VTVDVVLVLDVSGSTRDTHLTSRDLAADVIYGLDVRSEAARVGTVAYSSTVVGQTYLADRLGDREAMVDALRLYSPDRGTTDTGAALDAVRTEHLTANRGARTNVHKASHRHAVTACCAAASRQGYWQTLLAIKKLSENHFAKKICLNTKF